MSFIDEKFKSVENSLKDILNSGDFNKANDCFYKLNSYIDQFVDDLFYDIDFKEYPIIYPIVKIRTYCLYVILNDNNVSNNQYKEIIKSTLESLDIIYKDTDYIKYKD